MTCIENSDFIVIRWFLINIRIRQRGMSSIYTVFCLVTETGCNGWSMPPDGIKTIFTIGWFGVVRAHSGAKVLSCGAKMDHSVAESFGQCFPYFGIATFVPKISMDFIRSLCVGPPTSYGLKNGSTRTSPVWIESYQLLLRHHQWSMPRLFRPISNCWRWYGGHPRYFHTVHLRGVQRVIGTGHRGTIVSKTVHMYTGLHTVYVVLEMNSFYSIQTREQTIARLPPMMAKITGSPYFAALTTDSGVPPTATQIFKWSLTALGNIDCLFNGALVPFQVMGSLSLIWTSRSIFSSNRAS